MVSEDILRGLLTAALHQAGGPSALPTGWEPFVPAASVVAAGDIRGILHARGYSDAKIDAWPAYQGYLSLQSLYWALIMGGGLQGGDDKWVDKLDQREQLQTIAIEAFPDGPVGWGRIRSESEFVEYPPELEEGLTERGGRPVWRKW